MCKSDLTRHLNCLGGGGGDENDEVFKADTNGSVFTTVSRHFDLLSSSSSSSYKSTHCGKKRKKVQYTLPLGLGLHRIRKSRHKLYDTPHFWGDAP